MSRLPHTDDDVVVIVEIVSPGNKDSRHAIRAFARKAVELLEAGAACAPCPSRMHFGIVPHQLATCPRSVVLTLARPIQESTMVEIGLCLLLSFSATLRRYDANPEPISPIHFAKIKLEMREVEVNHIFGCGWGPHFQGFIVFSAREILGGGAQFAGDVLTKEDLYLSWSKCLDNGDKQDYLTKGWIGNEFGIWVTFSNGRVVSKGIHAVRTLRLDNLQ